ncbi:hypothetical protein F5888DRAFT_1908982 [Russula emetica]|nr:hypothetical protein F5888DRAFT_1908982 [Russula emetica]
MSSLEHIPSPALQDIHMASTPPSNPHGSDQATGKGGAKPKRSPSENAELSVFDILNIFRRCWFLSTQKAEDGNISWVEFSPQYHSHLVKCAVALVPHPVLKVKKVMFGYILELLNRKGNLAFFDLQMGGRKANNAQKEKRRLARKRSRASKREREREAAKLPTRERQCAACGRKFESRKTAKKHKCPDSKVARVPREAAGGQASQATPAAKPDKPPAPLTSHTPTDKRSAWSKRPGPSNINPTPAVTGELLEKKRLPGGVFIENVNTGLRRQIREDQLAFYLGTEQWKLIG